VRPTVDAYQFRGWKISVKTQVRRDSFYKNPPQTAAAETAVARQLGAWDLVGYLRKKKKKKINKKSVVWPPEGLKIKYKKMCT
jgi:hypothetical protein